MDKVLGWFRNGKPKALRIEIKNPLRTNLGTDRKKKGF